MWSVLTSNGQRVDGIIHEQDARRTVHHLGVTSVVGPYTWQVTDGFGQRFMAELRHAS